MQTKGASETHPLASPSDEFADFGTAGWEYGNLTLEDKPLSKEMMPTNYLRGGLLRGLEQEAKLGANPFKFGVVGSTDIHNSLTAIDEDNFFGKHPIQEPAPIAGSTFPSRVSARRVTRGTTWRQATPRCGRPRTRAKPSGTR